jgi:hypothetical protein
MFINDSLMATTFYGHNLWWYVVGHLLDSRV